MIEEIKQRLGFYRKMQLWPIANELDYENWLDNLIWADLVLYICLCWSTYRKQGWQD